MNIIKLCKQFSLKLAGENLFERDIRSYLIYLDSQDNNNSANMPISDYIYNLGRVEQYKDEGSNETSHFKEILKSVLEKICKQLIRQTKHINNILSGNDNASKVPNFKSKEILGQYLQFDSNFEDFSNISYEVLERLRNELFEKHEFMINKELLNDIISMNKMYHRILLNMKNQLGDASEQLYLKENEKSGHNSE